MNNLVIFGIIGQDAQVGQTTQNGSTPIKFSVAVSEKHGDNQHTDWFSCTKFVNQGGSIKISDFLKKGTRVCVSGRVSTRAYLDRNGNAAASLDVVVGSITLGGGSSDNSQNQSGHTQSSGESESQPSNGTDDLPF